ncbi:DNA-binding HxlR family transcriptional regulator [Methanococcus maripaludis]|uniref:DNA-binding HxlR family transcriptional regulator n=1 Tax=Methanococcus maripaludis TaxID=39152 RepID=A0A7J9S7R0_METMI|nr:helix-turn-helix domain-containing protein [Methanococcus maripaludis]MBB6401923.1 DNA-binding HxlR family transcriptional regulator [Methanococcus maripaludis]
MILKTLSKSNVKEVLEVIKGHEKTHFAYIKKETGLPSSNLTRILKELVDTGLVENERELQGRMEISFYLLTEAGLESLAVYDFEEKIEKLIKISLPNNSDSE